MTAYPDSQIPPATERFAQWRGRTTHPDAVVTGCHERGCIGGWVASGYWWLHCGTCYTPDSATGRTPATTKGTTCPTTTPPR